MFFNKDCVFEAKSFENSNDFDSNKICNYYHWEIKMENYDLKEYSKDTYISITIRWPNFLVGVFAGRGVNCTQLSKIFKKYILNNKS